MQEIGLTPLTAEAMSLPEATSLPKPSPQSSPAAKRTKHKPPQKADKSPQTAIEEQKAHEAAKAADKAEENRRLSKAVNDHMRDRQLPTTGEEALRAAAVAAAMAAEKEESKRESLRRSEARRPVTKGVSFSPDTPALVSSEDVRSINCHVSKREQERAERLKMKPTDAARNLQLRAQMLENSIPKNLSESSQARLRARSRALSERMAHLQNEANERKRNAQEAVTFTDSVVDSVDGSHEGETRQTQKHASNVNCAPSMTPSMQQQVTLAMAPAAAAAAKVAGGVFYTSEEHVRVHETAR